MKWQDPTIFQDGQEHRATAPGTCRRLPKPPKSRSLGAGLGWGTSGCCKRCEKAEGGCCLGNHDTGRHQTRLDRRKSKERGSRLKAYASRGQNGGPDQWLAWGSPEPQERDHGWILQNAVLSYVARKGTVKVTALA